MKVICKAPYVVPILKTGSIEFYEISILMNGVGLKRWNTYPRTGETGAIVFNKVQKTCTFCSKQSDCQLFIGDVSNLDGKIIEFFRQRPSDELEAKIEDAEKNNEYAQLFMQQFDVFITAKFPSDYSCYSDDKAKIDDAWVCPNCWAKNFTNFCTECGTQKPKINACVKGWTCSKCGTYNKSKFCAECGQSFLDNW